MSCVDAGPGQCCEVRFGGDKEECAILCTQVNIPS